MKRQVNSEKARSSTTEQTRSSDDTCVSEIHSMLRTSWIAPNVYEFPDWVRLRRLPEVGLMAVGRRERLASECSADYFWNM
jgi:hypothetical protein